MSNHLSHRHGCFFVFDRMKCKKGVEKKIAPWTETWSFILITSWKPFDDIYSERTAPIHCWLRHFGQTTPACGGGVRLSLDVLSISKYVHYLHTYMLQYVDCGFMSIYVNRCQYDICFWKASTTPMSNQPILGLWLYPTQHIGDDHHPWVGNPHEATLHGARAHYWSRALELRPGGFSIKAVLPKPHF